MCSQIQMEFSFAQNSNLLNLKQKRGLSQEISKGAFIPFIQKSKDLKFKGNPRIKKDITQLFKTPTKAVIPISRDSLRLEPLVFLRQKQLNTIETTPSRQTGQKCRYPDQGSRFASNNSNSNELHEEHLKKELNSEQRCDSQPTILKDITHTPREIKNMKYNQILNKFKSYNNNQYHHHKSSDYQENMPQPTYTSLSSCYESDPSVQVDKHIYLRRNGKLSQVRRLINTKVMNADQTPKEENTKIQTRFEQQKKTLQQDTQIKTKPWLRNHSSLFSKEENDDDDEVLVLPRHDNLHSIIQTRNITSTLQANKRILSSVKNRLSEYPLTEPSNEIENRRFNLIIPAFDNHLGNILITQTEIEQLDFQTDDLESVHPKSIDTVSCKLNDKKKAASLSVNRKSNPPYQHSEFLFHKKKQKKFRIPIQFFNHSKKVSVQESAFNQNMRSKSNINSKLLPDAQITKIITCKQTESILNSDQKDRIKSFRSSFHDKQKKIMIEAPRKLTNSSLLIEDNLTRRDWKTEPSKILLPKQRNNNYPRHNHMKTMQSVSSQDRQELEVDRIERWQISENENNLSDFDSILFQ